MEKYDAFIPNLNAWVQSTTGASLSSPQVQGYSIQQLCAATQERCTGVNQQWNSFDECVDTLSQRNYGSYDAAWGDNVVCRNIHIFLTAIRPDVSLVFSLLLVVLLFAAPGSHADLDLSLCSTTAHTSVLPVAASASTCPTARTTSPTRPFMGTPSARRSSARQSKALHSSHVHDDAAIPRQHELAASTQPLNIQTNEQKNKKKKEVTNFSCPLSPSPTKRHDPRHDHTTHDDYDPKNTNDS